MTAPVTPLLAADVLIRPRENPQRVLLIQRRNPPHGWALPGGFVDRGERLEAAALREAREETGLEVALEVLLGCYSDPARDPRGHTVSAVYVATAQGEPRAADDARDARWVDPFDPGVPLAFDHDLILRDYLQYRATGQVAPLSL